MTDLSKALIKDHAQLQMNKRQISGAVVTAVLNRPDDIIPVRAGRIVAQESIMKATYDASSDTLTLELGSGVVAESDEGKPGVIIDYDASGNIVGIEILDASKRVTDARTMQFQVAG